MSDKDLLGFLASGLVLTTFWMRDMLSLRLVAIASNVAFISYGHVAHVVPVFLLHICLLPINLWHVVPLLRSAYSAWLDRNAHLTGVARAAQDE
jgi:antibiotic biosynthesis monooxygenase (ABM) superfamily enzyme